MKDTYQRIKKESGLYEVLGADGTILKNHNDKPYPHLSDKASKILIDDLNEIDSPELTKSFVYAVLSTMIEYQETDKLTYDLNIPVIIQWDRLFRFNPGPPLLQLEYNNTQKARDFLGSLWVNNQLNYYSSIEEMKENNCELVPNTTIDRVQELVDEMFFSQQFTVELLYRFFGEFSITLPVLWVKDIISDKDLIEGSWVFQYGQDSVELQGNEYSLYLTKRLAKLKQLLNCYSSKDETLPNVAKQKRFDK